MHSCSPGQNLSADRRRMTSASSVAWPRSWLSRRMTSSSQRSLTSSTSRPDIDIDNDMQIDRDRSTDMLLLDRRSERASERESETDTKDVEELREGWLSCDERLAKSDRASDCCEHGISCLKYNTYMHRRHTITTTSMTAALNIRCDVCLYHICTRPSVYFAGLECLSVSSGLASLCCQSSLCVLLTMQNELVSDQWRPD